jgi:shikimate kinase
MINKNVALIGLPACGKSTAGKMIAEKIKWSFFDTDVLIESFHPSLTCGKIFNCFGEAYFRHLESTVIQNLGQVKQAVIATGGGSLLKEDNRNSLQSHCLFIYLRVPLPIIKERLYSRPHLPAYLNPQDFDSSLYAIYLQRTQLYEKLAHVTIETSELSREEIVNQIIQTLFFI